ncbi:MAG: CBS domain-containing protein [Bacteroidetes bacterium]|nr:CBS domain-containing protein [Bacteroidota bacterium]MBS1640952.1 CBS domain-containing protein [Bacteroidota bacterium]MBS1669915.1 CBS domain-containing protein [Bacteroidota bacterium]
MFLASQLIQTNYPAINLQDKISFALQLMEDYDVQHLPVVSDDKFVGLISKDDLLDADETLTIISLEESLNKFFVKNEEYFLAALKIIANNQLSLIPVINEQQELSGVITQSKLLQTLNVYTGSNEPGGLIIFELDKRQYSFGEISRLVETNDAYITQLNTYTEPETGLVLVAVKINKTEISDIVATFQRYDYNVRFYFGEEQYANELKDNYNHLMSYLNI